MKRNNPFKNDIFFNNNKLALFIVDLQMNVITANNAAITLLRLKKNEIYKRSLMDFYNEQNFEIHTNNIKELVNGNITEYSISRVFKFDKNETKNIDVIISLIDFNKTKYLTATLKNAEKNISSDNDKIEISNLKTILKKSPIIQWVKDHSTNNYLFINKSILSYLGYSAKDIKGEKKIDFFYKKLLDPDYYKNIQFDNSLKKLVKEYAIYNKNNEVVWLYSEIIPLKTDHKGNLTTSYGFIVDVTERKRKEVKITAQQMYINKIGKILPEFIYINNLENGEVEYSNKNCKSLLGYTDYEYFNIASKDLIFKNHLKEYENKSNKIFSSKNKSKYEIELMLLHKTKGYRWYKHKFTVFERNDKNEPIKIIKTIVDIHKNKLKEEKIIEQESYIKTIASKLPVNVYVINILKNEIVYSNFGKRKILGYSQKDFLNDKHIIHEDFLEKVNDFSKKMFKRLDNVYYNSEILLKHKTKGFRWYKLSVKIFKKRADGKVSHILEIIEDIHKSKINQLLLDEKEMLLNEITSKIPEFIYLFNKKEKETIYSNKRCFETLGYSEEDFFNIEINTLFRKDDFERIADYIKTVNNSKLNEFNMHLQMKHKSKGYRWYSLRTIIFKRKKGKPIQFLETIKDINDFELDKRKLKEQHNLIQKITNSSIFLLQVSDIKTKKFIFTNFNNRKYLGYNEEEWLKFYNKNIIENKTLKIGQNVKNLISKKSLKSITDEFKFEHKDKNTQWLSVTHQIFKFDEAGNPTQLMTTLINITDTKNSFSKIQNQQKMIEKISSLVPEFIYLMNPYTKKLFFSNEKCKQVLGYNTTNFIKIKPEDILYKDDIERLTKHINYMFQKKTADSLSIEVQLKHKTKGYRWYSINSVIFERDEKGKPIKLLDTIKDIHETKQLNIKLQHSEKKLDLQVSKLEKQLAKNIELEKFASIASHDLKEPLRVIRNYAQILKSNYAKVIDKDGQELLHYIEQSTLRMNDLVKGILSFSKIDELKNTAELVDLNELLNFVVEDLSNQIDLNNSMIVVPEMPKIFVNKVLIRQVFQNLITNALKFSNIEKSIVSIEYKKRKNDWLFSIEDNGIGIPKNQLNNIFGIFKKLHNSKNYEGQGIGLSICKRIIDRHEGEIWVESKFGKGSKFFFTIPIT